MKKTIKKDYDSLLKPDEGLMGSIRSPSPYRGSSAKLKIPKSPSTAGAQNRKDANEYSGILSSPGLCGNNSMLEK